MQVQNANRLFTDGALLLLHQYSIDRNDTWEHRPPYLK